MRAFLAIKIPDKIKEEIARIQRITINTGLKGKIVPKDQLHFTVKFLGEIDDKLAFDIKELIESSDLIQSPFKILVRGVGTFPNIDSGRKPNIVWVGTDSDELKQLIIDIHHLLGEIGIEPTDKDIIPHITTIRRKEITNIDLLKKTLKDLENVELGEMNVNSMTLYNSVPAKGGRVYKKIWTIEW